MGVPRMSRSDAASSTPGPEALAHTLAERQQRGEIPAGRIVSAKPAR